MTTPHAPAGGSTPGTPAPPGPSFRRIRVTGTQNETIKRIAGWAADERLDDGTPCVVVEGEKLLGEAIEAGWRCVCGAMARTEGEEIPAALAAARTAPPGDSGDDRRALLIEAPAHVLGALSRTKTPQLPLGIFIAPAGDSAADAGPDASSAPTLPHWIQSRRRLLVLDALQDPGNVGTLVRSALAFGFDGVVATRGCARIVSHKVMRASAGTLFHIAFREGVEIAETIAAFSAAPHRLIALDPHCAAPLSAVSWTEPLALVVGSEAHGIASQWADIPGDGARLQRVRIPMRAEVESLNAGVSASIAMATIAAALD